MTDNNKNYIKIPLPSFGKQDGQTPKRKLPPMLFHVLTVVMAAALVVTQDVWAAPFRSNTAAPLQVPSSTTSINYQGRLFDQGTGDPLNATVDLEFSIHDAGSGGALLWGPEQHLDVPVSDGLFDVALGEISPLSPSLFGADRWLEIKVETETLSPRQQLLSVPVAQVALSAQEALGVPAGSIGSREFAPPLWSATFSSEWYTLPGVTPTEIASMTIEDADASHVMVWVSVDSYTDTGNVGRIFAELYIDGVATGYRLIGQSGVAGNLGVNTASATAVLDITPGQTHDIQIYSWENGVQGFVRPTSLIVMPLYGASSQTCTVSSVVSSEICTVFNLPFAAP